MNAITKNIIVESICVTVGALILWPLLDMGVAQFITHTAFQYSILAHVVSPLIFGAVFTAINMLFASKNLEK